LSKYIPIKLKRVSFEWQELGQHSVDDRSIFAFACLVQSEIIALRNILLLALHKVEENSTVDCFVSVQRNMLIRLLTGKLWEFTKALGSKASSRPGISPPVRAAIEEARAGVKLLKSLPGWIIAATLRDKLAFHYDMGALRKNVQSGIDNFAADFLIAETDGNCVFRLGEVVANGGRQEGDFDDLLDWNQKMSRVSFNFHVAVTNILIPSELYLERERIEEVNFPLDLVCDQTSRLPVIWSTP